MLRPATTTNIPFILGLLDRPDNLDKLERYDPAQLEKAIRDQDMRLWLWGEGEAPGGFIWLTNYSDHPLGPKIEEFAVDRPGKGIGSALMSAVFDRIKRDRGSSGCWLKVAGDNLGAIRFYERLGFIPQKIDPAVWKRRSGPIADALTMTRTEPFELTCSPEMSSL